LRGVARAWAERDPAAALAYGAALGNAVLRVAFCNEVLAVWSRLDAAAALAAGVAAPFDAFAVGANVFDPLAAAAALEPELALALADGYPEPVRQRMRNAASRALADVNLGAARARAETATGLERETLLGYVAESWAAKDPDAALAWIESLNPPSDQARAAAIRGLARVNFDRAVDLWLAPGGNSLMPPSLVGLPLTDHLDRMPALMDRLVATPSSNPL